MCENERDLNSIFDHFTPINFYKRFDLSYLQRDLAEQGLCEFLTRVATGNSKYKEKAKDILQNLHLSIKSRSVEEYWERIKMLKLKRQLHNTKKLKYLEEKAEILDNVSESRMAMHNIYNRELLQEIRNDGDLELNHLEQEKREQLDNQRTEVGNFSDCGDNLIDREEISQQKASCRSNIGPTGAQDPKQDRKKAREWEEKRSRGKTYINQPIIGNGNVVGFNSNINSGTFTGLSKRESSDDFIRQPKRKKLSLSKDKKSNVSVKKAKTTGRNMDDDIDYQFISDNRAINLADFSKDNSSSSSSIRGSVSFDNPFDNKSQDLNNSTIPGSGTESINVFNSSDDDFMPIQPKQKRNLSLPKKADDDKDPKSTDSSSKQRRKSSEKAEKSDISEKIEYQDESVTKTNRQKENNNIKRTFVLEWNLYKDLKQIVTEWTIDDTNISEAFFRFKSFAESKVNRHELKFSEHPGEILALNSILLLEENSVRVQLNISSAIRTKIFEQMRAIYPKYDLPKVVEDICHRCAQVARKQTREALEEEIDNAYNDLRTNSSPSDKKLLRISQNVWNHIWNWRTSFDSLQTIEDTHVHHSIHPFLRPFFPDGPDRTIDWANKLSFVSASRKKNDDGEGEGHKPDFTITVNKISGKFEVVFGLFKSPYKSSSHFANVDLVDLGVLMKDSLDNMYKEKCLELDMAVFGIHAFGYNVRIYAMDLSYDAVYRMYLIGEFEMPKSNISLCLVENALHEVENLKNFVEEYIERLPSYTAYNENTIKTPTEKMRMTRKTVATPRKVELMCNYLIT
ncbi:8696_t:CDS:10 [Funneliformis caledonium]|uniref:8696_t:CDS:1 n=1 Tax=Funneliformis caledonium TaxID=1117310 RepID=A0A9N8VBF1_9GLOM|nr:8696_t:CDS:10 [Funneliformis caledonium]